MKNTTPTTEPTPNWTPGPWRVDRARPDGYAEEQHVIRAATPWSYATDVVVGPMGAEGLANSQLIASAPALYEALAGIVAEYDATAPALRPMCLVAARRALAKARGETTP